MDKCDFCGSPTEHAFQCNYCGQDLCGDHRLPEKHECPMHVNDESSFGGQGPSTRDRRGTGRKRIERVREKETTRDNPPTKPREPQSKGDYRDNKDRNIEVLTCPACGKDTDRIFDCEDCGQSVCPACEDIFQHECPVGVTTNQNENENEPKTLVGRLIEIFR